MGSEHGRHDKDKIISVLKEANQVYYDRAMQAVHIIFWARELAKKMEPRTPFVTIRNRTFTLRNDNDGGDNDMVRESAGSTEPGPAK
ncbi:hypothetical protein PI124_g16791 [Phytophthora idaei]|nr:hypothetical protein PI126_g22848 [Phytophthora idaei]KAG3238247.1 hypothetical protein PI124_g16791 [Phytophthora idaei]